MSWPLASFAIVLGALGGCLWWYERSRPSAKLVAVVATLAALSALGRDAFVAIPDVKPTTAIALCAGYAFGAEVGFAVGALGALASNVLLGQGPWTPWQMLAWGLVGVGGAVLARLSRRSLGRVALALSCAVAAEGFNLMMDLYTWTLGAAHSASAFALVLSAAAAFDATHVVASFFFGFAFGPVLVRMLRRVRTRLEVRWREASVFALLVIAGLAIVLVPAGAGPARAANAAAARSGLAPEIAYLAGAQNADGGYGAAPGESSSELYSAWAALGMAAAGRNPADVRRNGHSLLGYVLANASSLSGAGDLERTILVLRAAGASVHSLAGGDPVARMIRAQGRNGSFGGLVNLTSFGVLALRAAGRGTGDGTVARAVRWLERSRGGDGGFATEPGAPSDVDDTAAALEALAAGGARGSAAARGALRFLLGQQGADGGFPLDPGSPSNAQSTAFAVQALVAAGRDPAGVRRGGSRSPIAYLATLVAPGGSVRYSRTSGQTPVWVTGQALLALARRAFPLSPAPRARPRVAAGAAAPAAGASAPAPPGARHAPAAARSRRASTPAARPAARSGRTAAAARAAARPAAGRAVVLVRDAGSLAGMVLGPMVA